MHDLKAFKYVITVFLEVMFQAINWKKFFIIWHREKPRVLKIINMYTLSMYKAIKSYG